MLKMPINPQSTYYQTLLRLFREWMEWRHNLLPLQKQCEVFLKYSYSAFEQYPLWWVSPAMDDELENLEKISGKCLKRVLTSPRTALKSASDEVLRGIRKVRAIVAQEIERLSCLVTDEDILNEKTEQFKKEWRVVSITINEKGERHLVLDAGKINTETIYTIKELKSNHEELIHRLQALCVELYDDILTLERPLRNGSTEPPTH